MYSSLPHQPAYSSHLAVDIDGFTYATSLAAVALVSVVLDLMGITAALSSRVITKLPLYVTGLILQGNGASALSIAARLGGLSHDTLNRLRNNNEINIRQLTLAFIRLTEKLGGKGWLIIDDTILQHPRSTKMEGVYCDFDHALGRYVTGSRLVLLMWTNGNLRIPLACSFWHKKGACAKYRTKNEIARTLLKSVIHRGVNPMYVTFDNWYASNENLRLIKDLGLQFVTRVRRNTRLSWQGQRLRADDIGSRLLRQRRQYRFRDLGSKWARRTQVLRGGLGSLTFAVVKDDFEEGGSSTKYLLASDPRMGAREITRRYRSRWVIEVFFRDLKQNLGLESYQGRSLNGQLCHVLYCFLAAMVLDVLRYGSAYTLGETASLLQRLLVVRDKKGELSLVTVVPATGDVATEVNEIKPLIQEQVEQVLSVRVPATLEELADVA